jgi:AraC family transcriptional regulator
MGFGLDDSQAVEEGLILARSSSIGIHALEKEIRRFSGARAVRISDRGRSVVAEHSHDWPILSLYVIGEQTKHHDGRETRIAGPSAVLHAAGAAHANHVGEAGLVQLDIEYDPAWLPNRGAPPERVTCWTGGPVAAAARALAAEWRLPARSERELRLATARFLSFALAAGENRRPSWLDHVQNGLRSDRSVRTVDLARELGLNPAWLAQAYRAATGEGLRETLQRRRIERAVNMLEAGGSAADIAAATGFCDQSHMIRAFRRTLGLTPSQVQAERRAFRS